VTLRRALADYLKTRRALGFKLTAAGRQLPGFVTYLDKRGYKHVTAKAAIAWASQRDASPGSCAKRLVMVRGFARYLQTIEARTEVPPLDAFPPSRARSAPYVYSPEDLDAVLKAADTLRSPLRAATYKSLIGLIAVTGMRIGEAIALDDADFDPRRGVIVVRKAKFGKTRELPLHASTVAALARYRSDRDRFASHRSSPSLFVSNAGKRLIYQNVDDSFRGFVYATGLASRRPRPTLHDLRHTFAIRTVLDWHRQGVDVEARMPVLSTYLGHVGPSSTYWYLMAIPELLEAATTRLERSLMKVSP
jgi:integrase